MKKKALVILAEGFEEIETITPIDILRRLEVEVIVAGINGNVIKGARNIKIKTDIELKDYNETPDAIILPGGMPGAENLANSIDVKNRVLKAKEKNNIIAAICASPAIVLSPLGVLDGREATCYPGLENNFSSQVKFTKKEVVQDGNIITSRGPWTAFVFGKKISENLVGAEKADMIMEQMLFKC